MGEFRRAIRIKPRFGPAWLGLGQLLEEAGRKSEAEEHYRKALTHRVYRAAELTTLARFCHSRGWFSEALTNYLDAIKLNPVDAQLHVGAGQCLAAYRSASMKPRSRQFERRDGKASRSRSAVIGLLLAAFGVAALLMAWKPWQQTIPSSVSMSTNSSGAAIANPPKDSAYATAAAGAATNAIPATNDLFALMNNGNELMDRGDLAGAIQKYR